MSQKEEGVAQEADRTAKADLQGKFKAMQAQVSSQEEQKKEGMAGLNISKNIRFAQNESSQQDDSAQALQMYNHLKAKGLGQDEQEFVDLPLPQQEASLYPGVDDRFRPRKPRYFNSVKTGFEWNKYNQTHYDADNPPPKVV